MSQEKRDNKFILNEDTARADILAGALASYETVTTTFGPKGKNVLIEKPFGRPVLTRDGVSVAREVYFSDRSKNQGAQLLLEASENTNRVAGDGTTATIALCYHLFRNGTLAIAAGVHPMEIKETYLADSYKLLERLDELTQPIGKGQLEQVATVSAGDANLGKMIADAVEKVGIDGGIIAEKAPIEDIECEYVDGYYLQSGFQALQQGKKELNDPFVIVAIKRISSSADAIELLNKIAQTKQVKPGEPMKVVFVGNIEDGAYQAIVDCINRGILDGIIIKTPPMFGEMGKDLLQDVATYAGCEPIIESTNIKTVPVPNVANQAKGQTFSDFVGSLSKVVANKTESTLFSGTDSEDVAVRIAEIRDQIAAETTDAILEKLKDRVAKLEGKIALFKIGAATDTAREEIEYRVEDSIHATRAALEHGVVPGGGSTLLELSKTEGISPQYQSALQEVFKKLLVNANLPAEVKLHEALNTSVGFGFNLRSGDALVDLVANGILDPALVVREIIKNASETAANGLSIGCSLIFEDKED